MNSTKTRIVIFSFLTGAILALLYFRTPMPVLDRLVPSPESQDSAPQSSSYWSGWDNIEQMVVFGDSITTTHFSPTQEPPSQINPLGNPAFPGLTTANGPNWVGYLTATYNGTFLKTVNLAYGGATVDKAVVHPSAPDAQSFKEQLEKQWLPNYVPPPAHFDWKPESTLFVTFFGNNDVRDTYHTSGLDGKTILEADVNHYLEILDRLYDSGARNLLVINTMPLERTPLTSRDDSKARQEMEVLVKDFNVNLAHMVSTFSNTHPDATMFEFDTYSLFHQLLDDPCSYDQTCPLQVTTTMCQKYRLEREDSYKNDPECEAPADKYFWLTEVHPSFRVHEAMARAVAAYLNGKS